MLLKITYFFTLLIATLSANGMEYPIFSEIDGFSNEMKFEESFKNQKKCKILFVEINKVDSDGEVVFFCNSVKLLNASTIIKIIFKDKIIKSAEANFVLNSDHLKSYFDLDLINLKSGSQIKEKFDIKTLARGRYKTALLDSLDYKKFKLIPESKEKTKIKLIKYFPIDTKELYQTVNKKFEVDISQYLVDDTLALYLWSSPTLSASGRVVFHKLISVRIDKK